MKPSEKILLAAIEKLEKKVDQLESHLLQKSMNVPTKNTKEAAAYLGMSISTLNKKSSPTNMEIPCSKSGGKNKLFFTRDLDTYLDQTKSKAA